jgi:hypothetical protein
VFDAAIIHLSDLECGKGHRGEDRCYRSGYNICDDRLIKDIATQLEEHGVEKGQVGLVITGDVTDRGREDEFEKAAVCVGNIADAFAIRPGHIAVVPGNHDVSWADTEKRFRELNPGVTKTTAALREPAWEYEEKLAAFRAFHHRVTGLDFVGPNSAVGYDGFSDLRVALVGFDTTLQCTFVKEDNKGFLRMDPFVEAEQHLKRILAVEPEAYPMAAMHHSPFPAANRTDRSLLQNDVQVRDWLSDYGFSIVVCGHEHNRATIEVLDAGLQVLQAGAYGIDRTKLRERYTVDPYATNGYEILFLGPADPARCYFRSLREPGKAESTWMPETRGGKRRDYADIRRAAPVTPDDSPIPVLGNPVRFALRPNWVVVSVSMSSDPEDVLAVTYTLNGATVTVARCRPSDCFRAELGVELRPGDEAMLTTQLHYDGGSAKVPAVPLAPVPLPPENPRWSLRPPVG